MDKNKSKNNKPQQPVSTTPAANRPSTIYPQLKDAPLPWSIVPSALFECQVVSSEFPGGARTIIFQGPRNIAEFIVERANQSPSNRINIKRLLKKGYVLIQKNKLLLTTTAFGPQLDVYTDQIFADLVGKALEAQVVPVTVHEE